MFHIECMEQHFAATKDAQGYKCCVCQKQYGVHTGDMPHGTMTWQKIDGLELESYESLKYAF